MLASPPSATNSTGMAATSWTGMIVRFGPIAVIPKAASPGP
jgi:hypothetical protein